MMQVLPPMQESKCEHEGSNKRKGKLKGKSSPLKPGGGDEAQPGKMDGAGAGNRKG